MTVSLNTSQIHKGTGRLEQQPVSDPGWRAVPHTAAFLRPLQLLTLSVSRETDDSTQASGGLSGPLRKLPELSVFAGW